MLFGSLAFVASETAPFVSMVVLNLRAYVASRKAYDRIREKIKQFSASAAEENFMRLIFMKRGEYTQFCVLYTMGVVTEPWRVIPTRVGRLNACDLRLRAHTPRAPSLTPNAVFELKLQLSYHSKEKRILYKTGLLASLFDEKCVRRKR